MDAKSARDTSDDSEARGGAGGGVGSTAGGAVPFCAHRADRATRKTLLSELAGAHSVGAGVLGFFSTREARALRLACEELCAAVAAAPWADAATRIARDLGAWRASFPRARGQHLGRV